MPKLLKTPFAIDAAEGFRTDIQESTGVAPNSATYQVGFPPVTMQSIASNGMPPKGSDLNGVLYDITDNLVFLTQGGVYGFDAAYATSIGGYPLNTRLRLANGDIVKSTIDGNVTDPNIDMTGWLNTGNTGEVESIAELLAIQNPKDGSRVFVKGYFQPTNFALAKPYKGGGHRIYVESRKNENDGFLCINGWLLQLDDNIVTVEMGGVKGDGITDDSAAIQNIVKVLYPSSIVRHVTGGGYELNFDAVSTYAINNEILLPPFCRLNGNNCLLKGNNKLNDCFVSAQWSGTSLIKSADATIGSKPYQSWSSIERFQFTKFNKNVHIYGWTQQCYLEGLESYDSIQHIVSREHYFLTVERCTSSWTGVGSGLPNYDFGVYSGMLTLNNLQASSCDIAFRIYQGAQAVTLNKLDAESVGTAIIIDGESELGGVLVTGGYFENCDIVIDATNVGPLGATIDIQNSFINGENTIVCKSTGGNSSFIGKQESNYLRRYKTWVEDINASSLSKTEANPATSLTGTIAPNSPNGVSLDKNKYYLDDPISWCKNTHTQTITSVQEFSGKTQAIHSHNSSVIPATYYGNQGDPEANIVPFCTHSMTTPAGGIFSVVITTAIVSKAFVQGVFNLELLTDNSAVGMLSGRFYQTKAYIDTNDKTLTVSASTVNNVIVLTVGGLTGTGYQCRGFIKLI